jgi:membrane protease YdiL (CAAX protease family)
MEDNSIFLRITSGFFIITIISKILEFFGQFQSSFIIEVIGLILVVVYFSVLVQENHKSGLENIIGLKKNTLLGILGISFLISIPWWIDECVSLLNSIYYRRAFATYSYSTLIKAPIFEEIYFRGILLWFLRRKYKDSKSIIFSSLLFSLIHLPILFVGISAFTIGIIIGSFIFGLILSKLQLSYNNLWIPILLHFVVNLLIIFSGIDPIISNSKCS